MTNHMMIDLETLSTSPRAVIVQLGCCVFDFDTGAAVPGSDFQANVSVDECLALGGEVHGSTVMWWLNQSEAARWSITEPPQALNVVLSWVTQIYDRYACEAVWSQGAAFDVVVVEHYYRALRREPPWRYSAVRDTRTVYHLAESLGWLRPTVETAHTALADCVSQVAQVAGALS